MAFGKKKKENVEKVETEKTEAVEPVAVTDGRQAPHAAIQINGALPISRHLVING